MSKISQRRSPEFKVKIAVEALKGEKTIVQLASEHCIHPKQIQRWRDQLLDEAKDLFVHKSTRKNADPDKEKLINIINHLTLELEFLKKKLKKND